MDFIKYRASDDFFSILYHADMHPLMPVIYDTSIVVLNRQSLPINTKQSTITEKSER